jgi:uncharacterized phage protein (TIGR02218 family)
MTYDALEVSEYDGDVVEVYRFIGSVSNYLLTSYATDFTYNFENYVALPGLGRQTIKKSSSGGSQTGELEVELPFDHPLAQDYAFSSVPPNLDLTLLRGHRSDAEFRTLWSGKATAWTVAKRIAKVRFPSSFTIALQNTIPSRRWQGPCNHLLYDNQCGVNRTLHDENSTVLTYVGNTITLVSLSWVAQEGFGGEIVNNRTGERRSIESHTGDTITMKRPFNDTLDGDPITVFKGCDHEAATCLSVFNNIDNFGGFNLVPSLNPFTQERLR